MTNLISHFSKQKRAPVYRVSQTMSLSQIVSLEVLINQGEKGTHYETKRQIKINKS